MIEGGGSAAPTEVYFHPCGLSQTHSQAKGTNSTERGVSWKEREVGGEIRCHILGRVYWSSGLGLQRYSLD